MPNFQVQQPDILGSFLSGQRAGQEVQQQAQERNRLSVLRDNFAPAAQGDKAARAAVASADPNIWLQLEDRDLKQKETQQKQIAALAYGADTPEKWAQATAQAEALGIPNARQIPFEQREAIVRQTLSVSDQIEQEFKRRSLSLDESRTKAQNAASYASADASRASADYTRAGRGKTGPQLPQKGQAYENEGLEKIQIASNNNNDVAGIIDQIDNGQLDPGLLSNKYSEAKSWLGAVDPNDQNTRNYNSFLTTMERLRNESLRLNKGVQTDSDAQRAWAELFKNINDKTIVRDQLARISKLNERAAKQHAGLVRNNRKNYLGDSYEDPDWELLGIDPALVSNGRAAAAPAAPTTFVRGGAGIFSNGPAAGAQSQQAPLTPSTAATIQGGGRIPSGGGAAGAPLREGQTSVSKSGKPMVVRGGKWAYQ